MIPFKNVHRDHFIIFLDFKKPGLGIPSLNDIYSVSILGLFLNFTSLLFLGV